MFTDISLPVESISVIKKTTASSSHNQSEIASAVRAESYGPLIGGLSRYNCKVNQNFKNSFPDLKLQDCLSAFMREEELQQDVECQICSWTETLKSFERKSKSTSVSMTDSCKFTGQEEEERFNELILQQFRTAMPKGKLDSCSLDLDDVLFPTAMDTDDISSIGDSVSMTRSVRSCNNIYSTWRMRNCLGSVTSCQDKSMKLDPYLVQKVRTRTRKQLILSRPPPLLCLHICRRVADALTGQMKKLNHHVSFPGVLDINDYVNAFRGSLSPNINNKLDQTKPESKGIFNTQIRNKAGSGPNEYLLRSVIVHTGSSEAGTYDLSLQAL